MNVHSIDLRHQDGEVLFFERHRASRIATGRSVQRRAHMPSLSEFHCDPGYDNQTVDYDRYQSIALQGLSDNEAEPAPLTSPVVQAPSRNRASRESHPWRRLPTLGKVRSFPPSVESPASRSCE